MAYSKKQAVMRRCQLLCVNTSEEVRAQDGRHEYGGAGARTGARSGGSAARSGVLGRSNVQGRRGWGAVDWGGRVSPRAGEAGAGGRAAGGVNRPFGL